MRAGAERWRSAKPASVFLPEQQRQVGQHWPLRAWNAHQLFSFQYAGELFLSGRALLFIWPVLARRRYSHEIPSTIAAVHIRSLVFNRFRVSIVRHGSDGAAIAKTSSMSLFGT